MAQENEPKNILDINDSFKNTNTFQNIQNAISEIPNIREKKERLNQLATACSTKCSDELVPSIKLELLEHMHLKNIESFIPKINPLLFAKISTNKLNEIQHIMIQKYGKKINHDTKINEITSDQILNLIKNPRISIPFKNYLTNYMKDDYRDIIIELKKENPNINILARSKYIINKPISDALHRAIDNNNFTSEKLIFIQKLLIKLFSRTYDENKKKEWIDNMKLLLDILKKKCENNTIYNLIPFMDPLIFHYDKFECSVHKILYLQLINPIVFEKSNSRVMINLENLHKKIKHFDLVFTEKQIQAINNNKNIDSSIKNFLIKTSNDNKKHEYKLNEDDLNNLYKFIYDYYHDKTIMTPDVFTYIIGLIKRSVNQTQKNHIFNEISDACKLNDRLDLMKIDEKFLFANLPFTCYSKNSKMLSIISRDDIVNADKEKLKEIKDYLSKILKQIGGDDNATENIVKIENLQNIISGIESNPNASPELLKMSHELSQKSTELQMPDVASEHTQNISIDIPTETHTSEAMTDNPKISEKSTSETSVIKINDEMASNLLNEIRNYLDSWDKIDDYNFDEIENDFILEIGNNKISAKCLLNYLSGDLQLFTEKNDDCSKEIKNILGTGNTNLKSLFATSKNKDFLTDSDFYYKLYKFNISMANIISKKYASIKNKEHEIKLFLVKVQDFFRDTIKYLFQFMETYNIIDNKLISSGNNLMYLCNILVLEYINVNNNIAIIKELYEKLKEVIKTNINMYKKIDTHSTEFHTAETDDNSNLIAKLKNKLEQMNTVYKNLEQNIDEIKNKKLNLENMISKDVKLIGDAFRNNNEI